MPRAPPQPGREGETRAAGSSRKWRKPQECFQKGTLGTRARGTRKNAQTKTQSGGGEASEAVGAEQSLKKKKSNREKVTVPYTRSKTRFSAGRNVRSFDTSTNKRPYPNPVVQVRNTTAVSGGAGLGIYEQVSPTFMPNPKSSPLRAGPPSAAAASDLITPQSQRGDP